MSSNNTPKDLIRLEQDADVLFFHFWRGFYHQI